MDVTRASDAIEFLNTQIAATSLAGMHDVLYRLVEEQTKTIMLAQVSSEYLLTTIDAAVVPELWERPKRALIVVFGAIAGLLLGAAVQILLQFVRRASPVADGE